MTRIVKEFTDQIASRSQSINQLKRHNESVYDRRAEINKNETILTENIFIHDLWRQRGIAQQGFATIIHVLSRRLAAYSQMSVQ